MCVDQDKVKVDPLRPSPDRSRTQLGRTIAEAGIDHLRPTIDPSRSQLDRINTRIDRVKVTIHGVKARIDLATRVVHRGMVPTLSVMVVIIRSERSITISARVHKTHVWVVEQSAHTFRRTDATVCRP